MQKIQIPIGMFSKGSVIYIDFPYEDSQSKSKNDQLLLWILMKKVRG